MADLAAMCQVQGCVPECMCDTLLNEEVNMEHGSNLLHISFPSLACIPHVYVICLTSETSAFVRSDNGK